METTESVITENFQLPILNDTRKGSSMFSKVPPKTFEGQLGLTISWNNFSVIGMLEKSGPYDMYVVTSEKTQKNYLAKVIPNKTAEEYGQQNYEVAILYLSNHPSVIKLYCHFEAENSQILILELLEEGSLYSQLAKTDGWKLSESLTAKYISQ